MNPLTRRRFLHSTAAASALAISPQTDLSSQQTQAPSGLAALKPLGDRVQPITADEFHARLQHAQALISQLKPGFDAILIGPGTSLYYFSSVRWWLSERLLALVIPRSGQPIFICPAFEEARLRESL